MGYGGKFRRGEGTPPYARIFKRGRRAASPLAAVAVCDGGKLRAGELAAMSVGGKPYSGKTKKRDGHCPVSFFFKRRRKTERLAGA